MRIRLRQLVQDDWPPLRLGDVVYVEDTRGRRRRYLIAGAEPTGDGDIDVDLLPDPEQH